MEMDIGTLIALIALFVLVMMSFYFALAETAFSTLNRIRMKNMADKGSKRAKLVLALHEDFDRILSTLLVWNNIANLSAAAICTVLFVHAFGDMGATLSTVVVTVVVVLFAEIAPKTLAKEAPERFALFCAPLLVFFMAVLKPFNRFFMWWQKTLVRLVKSDGNKPEMTEDELMLIVEEAEHRGVIGEDDKELIHNVIEFYDQKAEDILTPRTDVVAVSKDAPAEEIAARFMASGLSRLPVYEKSIDNIVGVIHVRDFLAYTFKKDMALESIISPAVYVTASMDLSDLFKLLQAKKSHLAVVTDEYGGTDGIVTMEDIFEELLGEIWDESDEVVEHFTPLAENKYLVKCSADTHDLFKHTGLAEQDSIEEQFPTVGSWVVGMLEKIPDEGDTFNFHNLAVTVHKTEGRRAIECMVEVMAATT